MSGFPITPRPTPGFTLQDLSSDKRREAKLPQIIKLAGRSPRMSPNLTQGIILPDISRNHTPNPRKLSPILTHMPERPSAIEKQLINLEKVIQQEDKLACIIKTLTNDANIGGLCVDYWELSNDEALWTLEKLFKETRTKKAVIDSIIVESLAVALLIFCSNHVEDWSGIANQMKNMVHFIHQNFLTIIDLTLSRLPIEAATSSWVLTLKEVVRAKKIKSAKRSEHSTHLKQHNEIISNCIRTVIRLLPIKSTPAISVLAHILCNRDKFSIQVARSYVFQQPNSPELLIAPPYLSEHKEKELTLVLDLDETLVHYSIQGVTGQLLIRPYCAEFIKEVAAHYELVVFTAGLQEYADWAIDIIDSNRFIKYRLYRQHTLQIGSVYIKDLSKLGRDLKKIIIVDNMPANFQLQQENGIFIKSWVGDPKDTSLKEMSLFLTDLAKNTSTDIRIGLKATRKKKDEENPVLNLSV